jgi:methylmalonic aciduria homocystinuria type C protein
VISRLSRALEAAGLDLAAPLDMAWYNQLVAGHPRLRPLAISGRESALAVLVGNTRALWPVFLGRLEADPALRGDPNPLDRYVEGVVAEAAQGLGVRYEAYFAHQGGTRLVSMLHAARAAGMARTGPAHLAVHPKHGPWFALRAVVVLDVPPGELRRCEAPDLCAGCPAPCVAALERAMATDSATPWTAWLAVRDACPVGRASRYGDAQARYHYTKDRAWLRE